MTILVGATTKGLVLFDDYEGDQQHVMTVRQAEVFIGSLREALVHSPNGIIVTAATHGGGILRYAASKDAATLMITQVTDAIGCLRDQFSSLME
jgi:alpha-galactosidase